MSSPSLRKPYGSWTKSDKGKATLFSEKLAKIFCPFALHGTLPQLEASQHEIKTQPKINKEVVNLIKTKLKPNKGSWLRLDNYRFCKNLSCKD